MENNLLEQLYNRYAKKLFLYIFSFCQDTNLAEDIMHDVFVKAMVSLDEKHGNFKAWLYKVARNTSFNRIKKDKRTIVTEHFSEQTTDDTIVTILKDERDNALYQAILELNEHSRQVLILQYIAEMPQRQIAEILGISPGNVRIISHRAKKELKGKMEDQNEF